jgi:predicted nucleotidyltransferase
MSTAADFAQDCKELGMDTNQFPNLMRAMSESDIAIERSRSSLQQKFQGTATATDIVSFGSIARREATEQSDFDYLVMAYGLDPTGTTRRALTEADELRRGFFTEASELGRPGDSGVFGKVVSAAEMVEVIGLQGDTNHSQTRRILLLEESVSLLNQELHFSLIEGILARYLEVQKNGTAKVPRFLLNDIVRYWRTITVDYQAKTPAESPFHLRYLKLIISRKIAFVAALAPLICVEGEEDQLSYLTASYLKPASLRTTELAKHAQSHSLGPTITGQVSGMLEALNRFLGWTGDPEWRAKIESECSEKDLNRMPCFSEARKLGREVNDIAIDMFTSSYLIDFSKKYLLF